MSVRKKLEKPINENIDIDALIEKGARVKEDKIEDSKQWTYINIRIPVKMLDNVDECVSNRIGITRTGWLLEAIHEKLKRSKNEV